MIRLPLFGKDSSPHRTSFVISIIVTIVFWLGLLIGCFFINPNNDDDKYETVQIILESTPIEEKPEESADSTGEENAANLSANEAVVDEAVTEPVAETPVDNAVENPVTENVETLPVNEPVPVVEEVAQKVPETKAEPKVETKPEPKPTPKQESKPEPKVEPKQQEKKPEPKPVEKKPEPQKTVETKAAETKAVEKTPEKPVETVHYDLVKSNEELMAEQLAAKKNKPKPTWEDMFGDDSDVETSSSTPATTQQKVVTNQSSTSGGAATVTESQTQRQTSQAQKNTGNQSTSDSTSEAIKKIGNTPSGQTSDGNKDDSSKSKPSTTSAGKGINITMADGSKRAIREPEKPEITLSKQAQQAVESNVTVIVSFTVQSNVFVSRSSIKFTPASVLAQIIQNEIIEQVSKWVFDPADNPGTASFEYTIKKK